MEFRKNNILYIYMIYKLLISIYKYILIINKICDFIQISFKFSKMLLKLSMILIFLIVQLIDKTKQKIFSIIRFFIGECSRLILDRISLLYSKYLVSIDWKEYL